MQTELVARLQNSDSLSLPMLLQTFTLQGNVRSLQISTPVQEQLSLPVQEAAIFSLPNIIPQEIFYGQKDLVVPVPI
jgi:hypothetical protein